MATRVIVNPSAGGGRAGERARAVRTLLEERLGPLEWLESDSAEHLLALAREAALRGDPRVIVAGGDGAAHFAANGVAGTGTALGILPVGTGNDIAYAAGVPRDVEIACDTFAAGHVRALDVGVAGGRVYCCVLGVGMDSAALERINRARFLRRGHLLYSLCALQTAISYRPELVRIGWDEGHWEGEVVFAAVTNTKSYAGGMKITPLARVDDGLLDLCVIPKLGVVRTLASFQRVLSGRHVGMPGIVMAQSAGFSIESHRPVRVTLDGELTELTTPIDVRVLPGALRVLGSPVAPSVPADLVAARSGVL
ncbi:MAG TPA: diacylglycerol kinase family protein [Planctomycetota bacterium]|nr:diacylglycerol kinase family protein [Planctomycetota bacterium]